jgi:hypothetical protein
MFIIMSCRFLYQVFPGTTNQCERLLLRASLSGDLTTIRKLVRILGLDCRMFPLSWIVESMYITGMGNSHSEGVVNVV